MSQYNIGSHRYLAQYGYDAPMGWFFLNIFDSTVPEDDSGYLVFSNLNRENPAMTIEEITEQLRLYGITVPDSIDATLEFDKHTEISVKSPTMQAFIDNFRKEFRV